VGDRVSERMADWLLRQAHHGTRTLSQARTNEIVLCCLCLSAYF
jgi:hypothetical protein